METKTITISGGFHNVPEITVRVKDGKLSVGQYKKIASHLCGISGCVCGGGNADVDGMDKNEFREMMTEASYYAHYGNRA